jgi:hypothetical protein
LSFGRFSSTFAPISGRIMVKILIFIRYLEFCHIIARGGHGTGRGLAAVR